MLNGTSTIDPAGSDEFYWYAPGADSVDVQLAGDGVWRPTSRELDPNGAPGFRLDLDGPEASRGGVPLAYGSNPFLIRVDGGAPQDGGSVYVGDAGAWLDVYDPAVYSAVVTGTPNPAAEVPGPVPFQVSTALARATGIIASLTAGVIHPAGRATDEFKVHGPVVRLAVNHRPVTDVDAVQRLDRDGAVHPLDGWRLRGDSVELRRAPASTWHPLRGDVGLACSDDEVVRVDYRFASTIGPSTREAVIYLARQFYLRSTGAKCELPTRTTSVTREGVSIQIENSQEYLDKGMTGVVAVDQWLATVRRPGGYGGRAAVYTPEAPVPLTVAYSANL
jgi:hypothetical protein